MGWIIRPNPERSHQKADSESNSYPDSKAHFITLALVALLVSVLITGLITPQLARSPFF